MSVHQFTLRRGPMHGAVVGWPTGDLPKTYTPVISHRLGTFQRLFYAPTPETDSEGRQIYEFRRQERADEPTRA